MIDMRRVILDLRERERATREEEVAALNKAWDDREALLDEVVDAWECVEVFATFRNKLYAPRLMYDKIIKEKKTDEC